MATENMEDWFDEEAPAGTELEYRKAQHGIWNEGYKEGLNGSKDVHLQQGFEDGFRRSTHISQPLGELLGRLQSALRDRGTSTAAAEEMKSMMSEISKFSNTTAKLTAGDATNGSEMENQRESDMIRIQSGLKELLRKGNALLESAAKQ